MAKAVSHRLKGEWLTAFCCSRVANKYRWGYYKGNGKRKDGFFMMRGWGCHSGWSGFGGGHMTGWFGSGMSFITIGLIIVLAVVIYMAFSSHRKFSHQSSATDILDQQYAAGKIDEGEYLKRKENLKR